MGDCAANVLKNLGKCVPGLLRKGGGIVGGVLQLFGGHPERLGDLGRKMVGERTDMSQDFGIA